MKNSVILIGILATSLMLLACGAQNSFAYTIDGSLADWGIDLSGTAQGYLDGQTPAAGWDVNYITDDNAASNAAGFIYVSPGWTYGGWVKPGTGGLYTYGSAGDGQYMNSNTFDVEAIYFDNDLHYAYLAIVHGMPITGGTAPGNPWFLPGDIAIGLLDSSGYGYGIKVNSFDEGNSRAELWSVSSWLNPLYPAHAEAGPWAIGAGSSLGYIDFVYSAAQNTHYVMEAAIPLHLLGLGAGPGDPVSGLRIHWTQECGNDYLTLDAYVKPIPEPGSLILFGSGLLGMAGIGLKRFRRKA